ncbi:MAG TPA: hypothetical protein VN968_20540 [Bradyrhizobium sp.]|jgi:hypothetical protein|nr:hypothetical protein [Bradyrhizobium sp.]
MTERIARHASRWPLWLRRGRCEVTAMALIGLGVLMLMQPLSLNLYSYSFVTILAGTLGFVIVSHFPD